MAQFTRTQNRIQNMVAVESVRRCGMRNVLWNRVLAANLCYANIGGFAGFRKGIITAVEVLAFLIIQN